MEHKTGTIETHDGLNLYYQAWLPEGSPRASIAYFHGGGGHSGQPTYAYFVPYFVEKGYAMYGLDQRGHGRSEGEPFYTPSVDAIRNDIKIFIEFIKAQGGGEPVFAVGQSVGGLLVIDFAMHHPNEVAGIVSVAPGLTFDGIPAVVRMVFRLLAKIAPKKVIKLRGMDTNDLSRDPNEVAKFENDPYSNLSSTPHSAVQLLDEAEWVQNNAITAPSAKDGAVSDQYSLV